MLSHILRAIQKGSSSVDAPQFVASITASGSTSVTIGVPSGAQAGDLLVALGVCASADQFTSYPTGWVPRIIAGTSRAVATLENWSGSPTSFTFATGGDGSISMTVLAFRNAIWDNRSTISSSATNPTAAAVTVAFDNSLMVSNVSITGGTGTVNTPVGTTSVASTSTAFATRTVINNDLQPAGASGTVSFTTSAAARAHQLSIAPVQNSPISFIGTTAANGASAVLTVPSGVQAGDLLILVGSSGTNFTVPSGWTSLVNSTAAPRPLVAYKFAGASESSVSIANTSTATRVCMLAYRGTSTAPVVSSTVTNSATSVITSTLTAQPANSRVLHFYAASNTSSNQFIPISCLVRQHTATSSSLGNKITVVDEAFPSGGTTIGRQAFFTTGTASLSAIQIVIKP